VRRIATTATLLCLPLLAAGCKSGGRTGVQTTPTRDQSALEKTYVGQHRILLAHADESKLVYKRKELGKSAPGCEAAVEVKSATLDKGTVTLGLEFVGRPRVGEPRPGKERCKKLIPQITLQIVGYDGASPLSAMTTDLDRLIAKPEAYLAANGSPFDLPAGGELKPVADATLDAPLEERKLARDVKTWARPLLSVEPAYYDPNRKVRHQGEVEFTALVGADGRLHEPRVLSSLGGENHNAQVAKALTLWRLEPARKADRTAVVTRLRGRTTFHIY
jgi:hypothetical protein